VHGLWRRNNGFIRKVGLIEVNASEEKERKDDDDEEDELACYRRPSYLRRMAI